MSDLQRYASHAILVASNVSNIVITAIPTAVDLIIAKVAKDNGTFKLIMEGKAANPPLNVAALATSRMAFNGNFKPIARRDEIKMPSSVGGIFFVNFGVT